MKLELSHDNGRREKKGNEKLILAVNQLYSSINSIRP
jgi:hypothetical protein